MDPLRGIAWDSSSPSSPSATVPGGFSSQKLWGLVLYLFFYFFVNPHLDFFPPLIFRVEGRETETRVGKEGERERDIYQCERDK